MYKSIVYCTIIFAITACKSKNNNSDGYGNFEATEITISSEAQGRMIKFNVEEGDELEIGTQVGLVDTFNLYIRKEQLKARKKVISERLLDIPSQINVLTERKKNLVREKERVENLIKDQAATRKQLDDIEGEIKVLDKELAAQYARLNTSNSGLKAELQPIDLQIEEIQDQIHKSLIVNPVNGTVLQKYTEENEIVSFAKPLYKIANLEFLYLRAYVSQIQLDDIHIGQELKVLIDKDEDSFHEFSGKITWISDKAEFTPKIVQTKEERVNLVYAIKVKVKNDGKIKIGMPGEVIIEVE